MKRLRIPACALAWVLSHLPLHAQPLQIKSFSVGPDQTLTYPNSPANAPYLIDLPDEHTTIMPPSAAGSPYFVFGASRISGGTSGAVVLETTDLKSFSFATSLGYNRKVMNSVLLMREDFPHRYNRK